MLKSISSPQVHTKKNERRAARHTTQSQSKGRVDTNVPVSIEEMLDFMGVISATSVNYSCALIASLDLTKTTSLTEQTLMPRQHAYRQQVCRLSNN